MAELGLLRPLRLFRFALTHRGPAHPGKVIGLITLLAHQAFGWTRTALVRPSKTTLATRSGRVFIGLDFLVLCLTTLTVSASFMLLGCSVSSIPVACVSLISRLQALAMSLSSVSSSSRGEYLLSLLERQCWMIADFISWLVS